MFGSIFSSLPALSLLLTGWLYLLRRRCGRTDRSDELYARITASLGGASMDQSY